jgi:hypothetical protein
MTRPPLPPSASRARARRRRRERANRSCILGAIGGWENGNAVQCCAAGLARADAISARSPHELSHKECRRWAVNQTSMVRVLLAEPNARTSKFMYFWLTDRRRKLLRTGQFRAICAALERENSEAVGSDRLSQGHSLSPWGLCLAGTVVCLSPRFYSHSVRPHRAGCKMGSLVLAGAANLGDDLEDQETDRSQPIATVML